MSKTAILLHGTGGNASDYFWFADTKKYLESLGYSVWWPALPNPEKPNLQDALAYLKANAPATDSNTIVIGHSSSCPLILSWLESQDTIIKQAVLVAGYYQEIPDKGVSGLMLQESYDWQAIKVAAQEILILNSDNDPWGCDDQQARPVAQALNAPLLVTTGQGHMGSGKFNQPYREFSILKRLLSQ